MDPKDLVNNMPEHLKSTLREGQFHKVAEARYKDEGFPVTDMGLGDGARIIGTKLAARRAEWADITAGLGELKNLRTGK